MVHYMLNKFKNSKSGLKSREEFFEGIEKGWRASLGVHRHLRAITYGHMFVGVRKCPWCPYMSKYVRRGPYMSVDASRCSEVSVGNNYLIHAL